jgi:ATP-dependent Clp protease ATP-binding subunit ClpC
MRAIVSILLAQVRDRLQSQEVILEIEPAAVEFLVERGFDPSLGARPLKRAIQRLLEDPLAEHILRGKVQGGGTVWVERRGDELDFSTKTVDSAPPADLPTADARAPQGG